MSWSFRRAVSGAPPAPSVPAASTDERLVPIGRLEAFSDGVFAIAITLLVLELHVPSGRSSLLKALEGEWSRYLGYFVSFAFIGGVWVAHSTLTRFIKAADSDLMRLNLMLLLFVSFLPFTTAIASTHLFVSFLTFDGLGVSSSSERVAVVVFGLNLTLAALMVYLVLRHAGRMPSLPADDLAEEELQAFARERRSALLLLALATVVGVFLPLPAVVFYLALAIFFVIDPLPRIRRARRRARTPGQPTGE
jgi:uncharacterized membrane protein